MPYTGGQLNLLNGKMGISAPSKSVPVMKLIKEHQPKSKGALVELIKFHFENKCSCGIRSQGTIEDFGANLFLAQKEFWGEYKFTLTQCIQWQYDLFIIQSLKGGILEKKALTALAENLPECIISEAKGFLDENLRIDLLIKKEGKILAGVQVKPNTFNFMRTEVIRMSKQSNAKWGHPVFYLFYDRESAWINLAEIVKELNKLSNLT